MTVHVRLNDKTRELNKYFYHFTNYPAKSFAFLITFEVRVLL